MLKSLTDKLKLLLWSFLVLMLFSDDAVLVCTVRFTGHVSVSPARGTWNSVILHCKPSLSDDDVMLEANYEHEHWQHSQQQQQQIGKMQIIFYKNV